MVVSDIVKLIRIDTHALEKTSGLDVSGQLSRSESTSLRWAAPDDDVRVRLQRRAPHTVRRTCRS
jgi:hypothetical protein